MNSLYTESGFKNKIIISLLIGILMNPILFAIVMWADSPLTSNEWLHGKPLLERTPFAYIFYWAYVFLPKTSDYFGMKFLFAVIGNTILYSLLSYILLTFFKRQQK